MKSVYLPQLDGLRFLALLAVFVHHLPMPPIPLGLLHERGWMGVDLFFVISAFLFFRLFSQEACVAGQINVPKFYLRRLLRLYPLMIAFPAVMVIATKSFSLAVLGQFLGIAAFVDNFAVWARGYGTPIPFTAHLWTLSFEFQVYAVIPLAFVTYQRVGCKSFLKMLLGFWMLCAAARWVIIQMEAPYVWLWVTPFLRPDTILAGIAISIMMWRPPASLLIVCAAVSLGALVLMPDLTQARAFAMLIYPLVAVFCGSVVWLVLVSPASARFLSGKAIAYLGTISFGLYVFHFAGMWLASRMLNIALGSLAPSENVADYVALASIAFVITLIAAMASYHCFEQYFLRLKKRATVVESRSMWAAT